MSADEMRQMSGLDLLEHLFEEEHVRLLWLAAADIGLFGDVAMPGEGSVAVMLSSLLATGTPRGGMHTLVHALVRCLRANGGKLLLNAPVARVELGGEGGADGPGFFYRPGVLSGVSREMRVWREEVFGPVAVLCKVGSIEEAIDAANDTVFGLGASIWSRDPHEQQVLLSEVHAGMDFVNEMVSSMPELPFGGVKRSGLGRELGIQGIREMCALKTTWCA